MNKYLVKLAGKLDTKAKGRVKTLTWMFRRQGRKYVSKNGSREGKLIARLTRKGK